MPDVLAEQYREGYDDAIEIQADPGDCDVVIGVATFSVDRAWDGTPTGERDPLPIRVYALDVEGQASGVEGHVIGAYTDIDGAREIIAALEAAILQVELTRDHRRRRAAAEPGHARNGRGRRG